jgi:hypothetical protein
VWGPPALVWKGEERISSNLGITKLGGRSPERGMTAAALGKIRREGEASGGQRQRSWRGNGGEGGVAREGGGAGPMAREWMSGGSAVFLSELGRRRAEREKGEERRGSGRGGATRREGGRGAWPQPAGGASIVTRMRRARAAHRSSDRGTPSADGRAPVAMREGREWRDARVGRPEKKAGWPSLDEQYGFGLI